MAALIFFLSLCVLELLLTDLNPRAGVLFALGAALLGAILLSYVYLLLFVLLASLQTLYLSYKTLCLLTYTNESRRLIL